MNSGLTCFVVPCFKGYSMVFHGKDPGIGDGDLVGISSKIFDCVSIPVEGLFDKGTPFFGVKSITKSTPLTIRGKVGARSRNDELTGNVELFQEKHEFPTEFAGHDTNREKEPFVRSVYDAVGFREPTAGDDCVDVRMVVERLPPCVQDLNDARNGTEILFVGSQFQDRFGSALVQETVKQRLVGIEERIQLGRNSKNDVVIGTLNDLSRTIVHPDFFWNGLTAWTVTVPARVVMDPLVAAVRALGRIKAIKAGLAVHDSKSSRPLLRRELMALLQRRIACSKDLLDISHDLPAGYPAD